MSIQRKSLLTLILVAMIWGGGFIGVEYALLSGMSVESITALRFTIAALIMGALNLKKIRVGSAVTARHGVVAGLLLFVSSYTQTVGQGMTQVSHAAFLTATNVVMIPFFLWALEKKRPRLRIFLLSFAVLAGVGMMSLRISEGLAVSTGDALVLLCAALFALHIIFIGKTCGRDDPALLSFWQFSTCAAASILLMFLTKQTPGREALHAGFLPGVLLGIFPTCLCFFLQMKAQRHVPPAHAGIAMSMEGVFGTLFSILLGLEAFRLNVVVGGAVITSAVALSQTGKKEPGSEGERKG